MKKITIILMVVLVAAGLSAQVKFRMNGICDWDNEREVSNIGGLRLEFVGDRVGFGMDAMGNSNGDEKLVEGKDYWAVWQGEVFVNYHFFGNQAFLDPYLQGGFGCAGKDVWTAEGGSQDLNMSLYPSLAVGVNAVFEGGLMLGMRSSCRPSVRYVPGAGIPIYDMVRNQLTFNIGYQFGGREKREREKGRYGCWKWCWCDECDCDGHED